jgi:hypothetical protein
MLQVVTTMLYRVPALVIVYLLAVHAQLDYVVGGLTTLCVYALFKISFYVEHKYRM